MERSCSDAIKDLVGFREDNVIPTHMRFTGQKPDTTTSLNSQGTPTPP